VILDILAGARRSWGTPPARKAAADGDLIWPMLHEIKDDTLRDVHDRALLPFARDDGIGQAVAEDLAAFTSAEEARASAPVHNNGFVTKSPAALLAWAARALPVLESLAPDAPRRLAAWLDLFTPVAGAASLGQHIIRQVATIGARLDKSIEAMPDETIARIMAGLTDDNLNSTLTLSGWVASGFCKAVEEGEWDCRHVPGIRGR
jgi:hypothetical protein